MYPGAEIAAALRGKPGQAVHDVSGTVLFANRERSLFVPTSDPVHQARALDFFGASTIRRIAGTLQLGLQRWTRLEPTPARLSLPTQWRERFDADLSAAALYCGSPGPLQKLSLLLPSRANAGLPRLVKVALRSSADETIAREVRSLTSLARLGAAVSRCVPELIEEGALPSGRRYLVTTAGNGQCGSATLTDEYLSFLHRLASATRTDVTWERGEALGRTRRVLRSLASDAIPPDIRRSLEDALGVTAQKLRGKNIPHTLMHGDFTRYNICQGDRDFVVFDWEYSRAESNPIADVLHFGISQRRVFNATRTLHSVLADAERFAGLAFGGWHPTRHDLAALALHALVDTIVVYAAADGRLDTGSFIVRRHIGLIRSSRTWMSP